MDQIDIKRAVKRMQDYWNTYDQQEGFESYRTETFLDDALFGIGLAINDESFGYAQGYDKFKEVLREHLDAEKQLMRFYGVATITALIEAQHRHIEKLQAQLARNDTGKPQRVREG